MTSPIGYNSVLLNPTKSQQASIKLSIEPASVVPPVQQASASVTLSSTRTLASLKEKFDVTDISNKDLASLSRDLANNGLITDFEAVNLSIVIVPPGSTYNPDARVNIVKQVQNQFELSNQIGSAEQTQSLSHVLDVLRALQR